MSTQCRYPNPLDLRYTVVETVDDRGNILEAYNEPASLPPPERATYGSRSAPGSANGHATTSLVLGIASIVTCWILFVGLVLGTVSLTQVPKVEPSRRGIRIAAFVTGIVGTTLSAQWLVLVVIGLLVGD